MIVPERYLRTNSGYLLVWYDSEARGNVLILARNERIALHNSLSYLRLQVYI